MVRNFKEILAASSALIALAAPLGAWAQAAPQSPSSTTALDEIIVTASRREESAQSAPLAISAVGGQALERQGVSQPQDLNKVVAGLTLSPNGGTTQVFLRGVGTFSISSYADSAVAFSVDGVFYGFPTAIAGSLFDLQRVEVLKGPQGTLYGRNATAGAINVIPNRPTFSSSGNLSVELGNYDLFRGQGAVNVPVNDQLALRLSGVVSRRDGYLKDGYNDEDGESVRLQALYKPNDKVSLLLAAEYSRVGGKGNAFVPVPAPGAPWASSSSAASNVYLLGAQSAGLPVPLAKNDGFVDTKALNVRAELSWDLGFGDLTVIPSHQDITSATRQYPGFAYATDDDGNQDSLEVRLASRSDGPLKWIVGAYGFQSYIESQLTVDFGLSGTVPKARQKLEASAVFTEATYSLSDRLRLTGGLRYSEESRTQSGKIVASQLTPTGPVFNTSPVDGATSVDNVSGKISVDFDINDQSLVYASYSTGFKAGGFNPDSAPNSYEPETLKAYTFGSKNRFFNNRLQLNIELFRWNYLDHQEIYLTPANSGGFIVGVNNIGKSHVQGANVDMQWRATDNDLFTAQVELLSSEYEDFKYLIASALAPKPGVGTACAVTTASPGVSQVNCSGKPFVRAPDVSATLGYQHTFNIADGARLIADIRSKVSSSYFTTIDYIAAAKQSASAQTDISLTWEPASRNWSAMGYVRNLENEAVYEGGFQPPFAPGVIYSSIRAPRTFGVKISRSF